MDFNLSLINIFLAVFVGSSIVRTLWNSIRVYDPKDNQEWIIISIFSACVMALGFIIQPVWAGWIAFVVWLVLVIIPNLANRYATRLWNAERYDAAIRILQLVRLIHPFGQWRTQPDIVRAQKLAALGDIEGASTILQRYANHPQWRFFAATELYRLNKQYDARLTWLRTNVTEADYRRDPTKLRTYLNALATVGDLNGMLYEFARYKEVAERLPQELALDYLIIFTYCGKDTQVHRLLENTFSHFPQDWKLFWLACADFAAEHISDGQQKLDTLLKESSRSLRESVIRLRDNLPAVAHDVLTPESYALLARFEKECEQMQRVAQRGAVKTQATTLTWGLIALNVFVFLVELQQGGAENTQTLLALGALWPPAVMRDGQWWRIATSMFLHFGIAHLALNMLALYYIGRTIEVMIGKLRYLTVYFIAGIGAWLVVLALIQSGITRSGLYVGASGAIMGLVGATAAIALRDWQTEAHQQARRELTNALVIIGLQVAAQLLVPQMSLEAHLGGAIIGFAATLLLMPRSTFNAIK